ncbi:hypothetical protein HN51_012150 [Arachis hypogaea]
MDRKFQKAEEKVQSPKLNSKTMWMLYWNQSQFRRDESKFCFPLGLPDFYILESTYPQHYYFSA